jgi:hypothetical protein
MGQKRCLRRVESTAACSPIPDLLDTDWLVWVGPKGDMTIRPSWLLRRAGRLRGARAPVRRREMTRPPTRAASGKPFLISADFSFYRQLLPNVHRCNRTLGRVHLTAARRHRIRLERDRLDTLGTFKDWRTRAFNCHCEGVRRFINGVGAVPRNHRTCWSSDAIRFFLFPSAERRRRRVQRG